MNQGIIFFILILMAGILSAIQTDKSDCGFQCGKTYEEQHLVNKSDSQDYTVDGCFCGSALNKGNQSSPQQHSEKNSSLPVTDTSEQRLIDQNPKANQVLQTIKKTTKGDGPNDGSDDGRCNVSEQKKYSPLNESEPGTIDRESIDMFFPNRSGSFGAVITWLPPKDNVSALRDYLVMWHIRGSGLAYIKCRRVLKNETSMELTESDGWKYPQAISLLVIARPRHHLFDKSQSLIEFNPRKIPEVTPVFEEVNKPRGNSKSLPYWAIVCGIAVAVVVIGLLVYIRKRKKHTPVGIPMTIQFNPNNTEVVPLNVETYFASYLPESEEYNIEVAKVVYKLGRMGYKVIFDQVDSVQMNEIGYNTWVDKQLLNANKILVFCSPGYIRLWQSLVTGVTDSKLNHVNSQELVRVRYEIKWLSDIYSENCSTSRIICIKTDPTMSTPTNLAPWMKHNMLLWPEQQEDLLRRLNDQAATVMNIA